jgi:hypothetical protein
VLVLPKSKVTVAAGARFKTEFVLISGRVRTSACTGASR